MPATSLASVRLGKNAGVNNSLRTKHMLMHSSRGFVQDGKRESIDSIVSPNNASLKVPFKKLQQRNIANDFRSRSTLPAHKLGNKKSSIPNTNFLENLSFTGNFENWIDPSTEQPAHIVANISQMNKTDANFNKGK